MIPPFLCVVNHAISAISINIINIPNVNIHAARIVIGINSAPTPSLTAVMLTAVSPASNEQTLPQETINVDSTQHFLPSGTLYICTNSGIATVNYTGTTSTSFTGCSGGTGTLLTGTIISNGLMATPTVNDDTGDISAPTPQLQRNNIYDFFEFSYLPVGGFEVMTINTSAINQFGLPIQLQVKGRSVQPGNQVGISKSLSRTEVIKRFSTFVQQSTYSAYNELVYPSDATPVVRILSPADKLTNNPVQGVTATLSTTQGSLSPKTTYSYVVTAVIEGKEVPAPASLVQTTTTTSSENIDLAWQQGDNGTTYNIYRGVPNSDNITWYKANSTPISTSTFTDVGPDTSGTRSTPSFDLLANYFDATLHAVFDVANSNTITLTVTDGSLPANGLQYTFVGIAKAAPKWVKEATNTKGNQVIEFRCKTIENNPNEIPPLIPTGSLFYIFAPFFNTNTTTPTNPSPPTWNGTAMVYANSFPSAMVFGANGIFADNVQQAAALCNNSNEPEGLSQNAYSVALGSLEDALNAAILRGVALSMNSVNWANAPTNPAASAGSTTVTDTSTYYYVITTVNASGESTPSAEVSYTTNNTSINLTWAPVNGASSYNIYRGTSAGSENILVGNSTTTSFEDKLLKPILLSLSPPTTGVTPAPANLSASAVNQPDGNLSPETYYYVVTALGYNGESSVSNEASVSVVTGTNAVTLTWTRVPNASAYKIYRGTTTGQENILAGIVQGGNICTFTDGGNATQTPPPNIYYAPRTVSDVYAQFFHQPAISIGGLAYASPFDDQGGQSSTLTAQSPQSVSVTLGEW